MSLTFVRAALVAGALAASLLGGTLARADDGDAPGTEVAAAIPDTGPDSGDEPSMLDALLVSRASLETALTTVLSGCRTGLLATRVTVIHNDIDVSASYILMSEETEFGRASMEKLDGAVLASCLDAMDMSTVDKSAVDEALETITTEMEALLMMS